MADRGLARDEEQKGGNRRRWACCLSAAGLVLVAGVAAVATHFLVRARPVLPLRVFFDEDADAVVLVHFAEHEALAGVLQHLANNPPAWLGLSPQQRQELAARADRIPQSLANTGYLRALLFARYVGEREQTGRLWEEAPYDFAVVVSTRSYSGWLRMRLNATIKSLPKEGGSIDHHNGVAIGTDMTGAVMAAVDNNFMLGNDSRAIKHWIDRIEQLQHLADHAYEDKVEKLSMRALIFSGPPVQFVFGNRHGEARMLLQVLERAAQDATDLRQQERPEAPRRALSETDIASDNVTAVFGGLYLVDPDVLGVELGFMCRDAASAQSIGDQLPAVAEQFDLRVVDVYVGESVVSLPDYEWVAQVLFEKAGIREAIHRAAQGFDTPAEPVQAPDESVEPEPSPAPL